MASSEELADRFRELRTSLEALPEVTEPPKPMLRILGSARAEQKWNTLLAYFLDPSQPHGFGADLLKAFLDKANQVTADEIEYYHRDIERVSVETEVMSPQNNRLDVLIRAPDEWFVCIESKVDAPQEQGKPERYVEDPHIGNEEKSEYPEGGHHYLFLSKEFAPNVTADEFKDIYWRHIVEAFQEELNLSHGQYPERSVSQLNDFISTIITVINMGEENYEETQEEKVQLLSEYRDDIDKLFEAAESLRERAVEEWPELFRSQVEDELWTDEWTTRSEPREWGCIFRHGWYLDNANLEPTNMHDETTGNRGFRLHFNHLIRKQESFSRGELTYRLRSPTRVDLRDEFHRLYNSDRWQNELEPLLDERGITNKGNKQDYMLKTYDVDQSGLPESYFETLAVAFEEHIPIAQVVDEILDEAVGNVKDN
ncbi:PD-(D/E)XK nuclease family protein [Halorubrum ezzemoulense]|uniref:PD-(D/E)XK nuclease family protein n=1 Tax=Halorubrum ezzemoulense TaxID=337243 RepID=UPI00232EC798|nr:PD-(D/E)XK nuclease family protein [Halorubrum ezzemoulense]MDB2261929.1 PD-(D/E)XK nuclease family protein [Halorubrum ezzemoulense]MDB2268812.1 PD-(D/E)XK nuclease family protein [Halorubrum ezzemoulense]